MSQLPIFKRFRIGVFICFHPGNRKKISNSPVFRQSVSQDIDPSAIQSFTHFDCCHSLTLEWKEAGRWGKRRQPCCTIPWCASMKTNWYLPDTWDWLSSIKGAAAVVRVSDWMARMRCLHFEFTCLPRARSSSTVVASDAEAFGRWPEFIFNYESAVLL